VCIQSSEGDENTEGHNGARHGIAEGGQPGRGPVPAASSVQRRRKYRADDEAGNSGNPGDAK